MNKAYKFLKKGRVGPYSDFQWPDIGIELPAVKGSLELCKNGYHFPRNSYLPRWIEAELYEVEIGGERIDDDDKFCVRGPVRLVRRLDGWDEKNQRLFACDCAERALTRTEKPDERSVKAVEVARLYAHGQVNEEGLMAAERAAISAYSVAYRAYRAAHRAAYRAAYRAADSAADSAADRVADRVAYGAAYGAADSVAHSAADSAADSAAWRAAYGAERKWQSELLLKYAEGG